MTAETLLYIIIAIIVLDFAFERILGYLNTTRWSDQLPKELNDIYNPKEYKRSQQYLRANYRFGLLTSTISFLAMLAMIIFGGFAWVDEMVRDFTTNPVWMAVLFFGILGFAADLLSTPLDVYDTFVIEE
ncbi:MAG: M48 family peptidase, partial [Bacteroidales bacterium]